MATSRGEQTWRKWALDRSSRGGINGNEKSCRGKASNEGRSIKALILLGYVCLFLKKRGIRKVY